ncbi:ribosomal protein L7/L12 [Actinophytocola sp.]|uniref:ribosomal protein L7/L12 n=1 Tax=Actinophytocola sp. TaxID=1872138 RepID=UPI00389AD71D
MSSGTAFILGFFLGVLLTLAVAMTVRRRPSHPPVVLRDVSEETLSRARELVASGQIVHAVKLVREETGLGLAQAKAVVDGLPHDRSENG